MEANQIRKIYEAMSQNGFSKLELEIGKTTRVKLRLDEETHLHTCGEEIGNDESSLVAEIEGTKIEIRSDKVGSFFFADRQLKSGDIITKGEIIGTVKGISFQDKVKCSVGGVIESVEVENGSIVDYGRLLFVVKID